MTDSASTTGRGGPHVKRLSDVDDAILRQLITRSFEPNQWPISTVAPTH